MDGQNWQTAAEASNVADVDLKEVPLASPMKARYVRFSPTYNECARMWELEGYGVDVTTLSASLETEALELNEGENGELKVSFSVKGDKAADFACTATTDKPNVTLGTPVEADGVFTIPVAAVSKGTATVHITVVNDGEVVAFDVTVKVTSTTPVSTEDAVTVTSWTDDLIAETRDLSSMDGISSGWYGDVYGFYTTGVEAEGALCDEEGIVEVPASGNVYKLPVAAKNAVALERYSDPVSLTIDGELATSQVNLLVFADTYHPRLRPLQHLRYYLGRPHSRRSDPRRSLLHPHLHP